MHSQNQQILTHLKRGHSITSMGAFIDFGCLRLASRIYDLKSAGHNIQKQMVDVGTNKHVAEYWLEKDYEKT